MEPIRVLNMFTIMNRGGAETMVMNYYRRLDKSKIQFDFLVHREERGAYEDEIEAMGGRIYRMIPIYPQNFGKYKKMLREFFTQHREYRIIHSHMSELGYFAFREAKAQGVPVRICHAHNAPHGWDLKMVMRNYFKRRMMPYITHMFVCGEESGDWLFGSENRDRFVQMNNAIDAERFRYSPKIEKELRIELGIEKKFVIGHVGRFYSQKNHKFLLEIFQAILKRRPESILILIGDGELKEEVEKEAVRKGIRNHIKFLGVRSDIDRIMQCLDAFVFPSLFEGLGIVLIEAQAAGVRCYTSKDVVPKEAKVTSLLEYLDLKSSADSWAEDILRSTKGYKKEDTYDLIAKNGYDINDNAIWLETFYEKVE